MQTDKLVLLYQLLTQSDTVGCESIWKFTSAPQQRRLVETGKSDSEQLCELMSSIIKTVGCESVGISQEARPPQHLLGRNREILSSFSSMMNTVSYESNSRFQ